MLTSGLGVMLWLKEWGLMKNEQILTKDSEVICLSGSEKNKIGIIISECDSDVNLYLVNFGGYSLWYLENEIRIND
jgi:hypothetical protein